MNNKSFRDNEENIYFYLILYLHFGQLTLICPLFVGTRNFVWQLGHSINS